jgi:hypothetical protein
MNTLRRTLNEYQPAVSVSFFAKRWRVAESAWDGAAVALRDSGAATLERKI